MKLEKSVFLTMLGNQFVSDINICAMFKCLYLCEKPPCGINVCTYLVFTLKLLSMLYRSIKKFTLVNKDVTHCLRLTSWCDLRFLSENYH